MSTITQLLLYPIKSCAAIDLHEALLTRAGLVSGGIADREWMVVDAHGHFLTQRETPQMATITPRLMGPLLRLHAPAMPPLDLPVARGAIDDTATSTVWIWDENVAAIDCGDRAAAWFSSVLQVACRLVRCGPHATRHASTKWTGGIDAPTRFADGFPILLVGQASLDDLNQKLRLHGRAPLRMNRFRPNLVIDGIGAFEEDYAATIRIGAACLKPVKPCPRCPIPSVDQETGLVGPDPLDILQAYRASPLLDGAIAFGMNTILLQGDGEVVRVGQECDITLDF